jgi:hypothetical protein
VKLKHFGGMILGVGALFGGFLLEKRGEIHLEVSGLFERKVALRGRICCLLEILITCSSFLLPFLHSLHKLGLVHSFFVQANFPYYYTSCATYHSQISKLQFLHFEP